MWHARPVACYACASKKKRCQFIPSTSDTCRSCAKKGLVCKGGRERRTTPPSSREASVVLTPPIDGSIGPSAPAWKLSKQQLTYSLTYHLLTVHIRHRPKRIFGGILAYQWDKLGDIAHSINGKVNELNSPAVQALVALGLADGARLSTHSAIIGSHSSRIPQFGSFTSVDDNLVTLGRRRYDALEHLNAQAMDSFDVALRSEVSEKEKLLWIGTLAFVLTPTARTWRQHMVVRCIRELIASSKKESLGVAERKAISEQSFFCLMQENVRAALAGRPPSLTEEEYVAAAPFIHSPSIPLYQATVSDLDLVFQQNPDPSDMKEVTDLLGRLFLPWRSRAIKGFFLLGFGRATLNLADLITIIWSWVDEIQAMVDGVLHIITKDSRFANVEKTRGSDEWTSWVCLHTVLKHFFIAETIYSSPILGCHTLIVEEFHRLGSARHHFLAASQKRLYSTLRRFDFILGLRDHVLNYDEPAPIGVRTQMIASAPLNGPCSNVSLASFPNLLESFRFMAFSSVESGDFLLQYGHREVALSPQMFADGSLLSDLPPKTLNNPLSRPSVSGLVDSLVSQLLTRPSPSEAKKSRMASDLVKAALWSVSNDETTTPESGTDTTSTSSPPEGEVAAELIRNTLDELA